jgi:hypothetical protein
MIDVNGARGAAIPGADFGAAFLRISIGPEPPNKDFKWGSSAASVNEAR